MKKRLRILVTAGPTREYFDPVRFLSNPSSGKMGYALAEEASRRGHVVTLVSGPSSLTPKFKGPKSRLIRVVSAEEMYRAVIKQAPKADLIIMAAAVSDYRPAKYFSKKVKKKGKGMCITLVPTKDILKELGRRKKPGQILVGFAAETDHLVQNAQKKLREKNLDFIVANYVGEKTGGFESEKNRATILTRNGKTLALPLLPKTSLACRILIEITDTIPSDVRPRS